MRLIIVILALSINLFVSCNNTQNDINSSEARLKDSIEEDINAQIEILKEDSISKTIKTQYHRLELINCKFVYDSNFTPTMEMELKNTMSEAIVAIEVIINPNNLSNYCERKIINIKIDIPTNSTVITKQKLQKGLNNCQLGNVIIKDIILKNGEKKDYWKTYYSNK